MSEKTPMEQLRDKALAIAIGEVGVKETFPNRGPRVEQYLRSVGLGAGFPWCAAFVVWCYEMAAAALSMPLPLPRTGKVARLWRKTNGVWRTQDPSVGAIYCHLTDPANPESSGHIGIVIRQTVEGIAGVEGNTDDKGSREGDGVLIKARKLAYVNLGFIDVGRPGPDLKVVS